MIRDRRSGLFTLEGYASRFKDFFGAAATRESIYKINMASEGFVGIDLTGVSYIQGVHTPAGVPSTPSSIQVGNNRRITYGGALTGSLVPQNNYEGAELGSANLLAATSPGSSNPNFIVLNWANGGQAWSGQFNPPTGTRYALSLNNWSTRLISENVTHFMNIHGLNQFTEESNGDTVASIVSTNITFYEARAAALAALTGQAAASITKTHNIPNFPARNSGVAQELDWALAIEAMCYDNKDNGYFCPTPLYILRYDPAGDNLHPDLESHLWRNELYGKFLRQVHLEGVKNWSWMRMQSAVASGNTVIVTVNVPALERGTASGGPVVFDSSGIIPSGIANQGFRYVANGGASRSITNVSLGSQIGTNYTIVITLSDTAPTSSPVSKVNGKVPNNAGPYIDYAAYGNAPYAGAGSSGLARGYVRDTETVPLRLTSTITVNGVTPGSWNWLSPGQQLIVAS